MTDRSMSPQAGTLVRPGHALAPPRADRHAPEHRRVTGGLVVSLAIYLALSALQNLPAWVHGPSHYLIAGGGGDPSQEVWFLAWTAHAVSHFANPLYSTWINVPKGYNLAGATSMPFAGLLGTPITLAFGPVVTYNVLSSFALFSSAAAAMFAARRWVTWQPAAFLAGLGFGFSPFMVGQSLGHLFLFFAPVIPLLLIVLDEIVITQRWTPRRSGVILGLLVLVQLGISLEFLFDAIVLAVVGTIVLMVSYRDQVLVRAPHVLRALGVAVLVAAPISAWYFYSFFFGTGHTSGPIHAVSALSGLSTDLAGLVVPGANEAVSLGVGHWGTSLVHLVTPSGAVGIAAEDGSYLSLPVLALVVGGLIVFRRRPVMRFFGALALVSLVLSMGSRLRIADHTFSLPLPFAIFGHLPVFDNTIAVRWSLFVWLFVAMIVAITIDGLRAQALSHSGGPRSRTLLAGAYALVAVGLVLLIPPWPDGVTPLLMPSWFSSSGPASVPEASSVLTYPIGSDGYSLPMLWQADDGMRWRIPGGEAGKATLDLGPTGQALELCYKDPTLNAPPAALVAPSQAQLHTWGVSTVVVTSEHATNDSCAISFLTSVIGRAPQKVDDVFVWRHVT